MKRQRGPVTGKGKTSLLSLHSLCLQQAWEGKRGGPWPGSLPLAECLVALPSPWKDCEGLQWTPSSLKEKGEGGRGRQGREWVGPSSVCAPCRERRRTLSWSARGKHGGDQCPAARRRGGHAQQGHAGTEPACERRLGEGEGGKEEEEGEGGSGKGEKPLKRQQRERLRWSQSQRRGRHYRNAPQARSWHKTQKKMKGKGERRKGGGEGLRIERMRKRGARERR